MRKILLMLLIYILIIFIIPILFTSRIRTEDVASGELEEYQGQTEIGTSNYSEFTTIRLLRSVTGEVDELDLDEYLVRSSGK